MHKNRKFVHFIMRIFMNDMTFIFKEDRNSVLI